MLSTLVTVPVTPLTRIMNRLKTEPTSLELRVGSRFVIVEDQKDLA